MTTGWITSDHAEGPAAHLRRTPDERRLRRVLQFNTAISALTVLACTVLATSIADLLGISTTPVFLAAVVAAAWTAFVGRLSTAEVASLRRFTPVAVLGDTGFVVGCAAVLLSGAVAAGSWWLVVPSALVVADVAILQFVFWRRIR